MEYQNQSQKSRSQTLSKISTGPAYLREWFKQENYFTNIFLSLILHPKPLVRATGRVEFLCSEILYYFV